jgi:exopolyphosphatase/guanosine-5'-triphosphate,3'-diphosphate pyrophosphatase
MASGDRRVAATIDVGSNSVLCLALAVSADGRARVVLDELTTTRLGTGLREGGRLDAGAAARTRAAVADLVRRARAAGATDVSAFATGAVRRAADGAAFADALARETGVPVEVLTGEREAALAYMAAVRGLALAGPVLAVDVGGATTELTLGEGERIRASESLGIGALALSEAGDPGPPIAAALAATDLPVRAAAAGARVVASGGTATSLAALARGLRRYDARVVHGTSLATARLGALAASVPADAPIDAGRAAILPAGARILEAVATAAGVAAIVVSDHGVRHAYLCERLAAHGVAIALETA